MSETYVIKPDNRSLKAFKGIEEVSFSFPCAGLLEEAEIREIRVDTARSAWEIDLLLSERLQPNEQAELETALAGLVLGLKELRLKLNYRDELPPLAERIESGWQRFINAAVEHSVGANSWIVDAKYELGDNNTLEIQVRNEIGVQYLAARSEDLQQIAQRIFLAELRLTFRTGDFSDRSLEEDEQRREEEAAVLESMLNGTSAKKGKTGERKSGAEVVYGRRFSGTAVPFAELTEEREQVIVAGEVFRLEARTAKTGKRFYLGDITDYSDSIGFKLFPRGSNGELSPLEERLQEGGWYLLKGRLEADPYAKELALTVTDIMTAVAPRRVDEAHEKRVELHLHTKMSAMDATVDVAAAIKLAAQWGHPAVAITDHGGVQSFPEAHQAAQKAGIKVIYGLEGYLVDDGAPIVTRAGERPIAGTTFVIFDLETTGFNPWQEDILEIGAVKIRDGAEIGEFHSLVRPGKAVSAEIQKLTGITPEMVADAPLPQEVLPRFLEFCGDAVLVAHNAEFDMGFIRAKSQSLLNQTVEATVLDTLTLSRAVWPEFKSHKLNVIARELGLELKQHHRAVEDARAAAAILRQALAKTADRSFIKLHEINILTAAVNVEHLKTYHIILLVQNQAGLKNLYRLVSESHLQYFHRHPRIPRSLLSKLREGLLLGTACEAGEFFQAMLEGASEERLNDIASFYDYLEIQPCEINQFLIREGRLQSVEQLQKMNHRVCQIAAELGKPVVATGDVHFLHPHEEIYRRVLQTGQGYEDAGRQTPLYFRTTTEMLAEFEYLGPDLARAVVVENSQAIAARIEEVRPVPAEFYPPQIPGADHEIREMAYAEARRLFGDPLPELVRERLEWELKSIISHGYAVLYLIAQKLVKKSLDDGYLVGSRGSVGSSFVATMCRITEVNPLPAHYRCPECRYSEFMETGAIGSGYDLPPKECPGCGKPLVRDGQDIPFATFMGFEGDKEPDIDLNFSGEYQAVVHRYTEELFGKKFVYRAGTITGLADKMAFGFVRGFMDENHLHLRQAEVNRLVKGCTGVRRSTGQHPGGMVVVPQDQDIYNFTPIQYPANDKKAEWITTHFDFHGALEGRLVKLDILGHDDPTVIRMLQDLTGIDPRTVEIGEAGTMPIFSGLGPLGITKEQLGSDLGTIGIPEFGTGFVRQMLAETRPTTFSELIYISGLSHGTNVWLGNAQELVKAGTVKLPEVISTRDDIMNHLIFEGLPPKIAFKIMEQVRKGRGLTPEDIEIMREHGIPNWYIDSCQKIKYMFPKAHAVAYVMMAFRIAYFKVHHPTAFYATYFSVRADEFDAETVVQGEAVVRAAMEEVRHKGNEATQREKNLEVILEVALEAMLRGIIFLHVDIYKSDPAKFLITPEGLLPPLASLQGLGVNAAQGLAAARNGIPFSSIEDLKTRARLSSSVIDVLQKHGCLEGLTATDQLELF